MFFSHVFRAVNRIGPQLSVDRPRVLAFGGGKGGVGRTTLCTEVARSFARRHERVLCVDASWGCPTIQTHLVVDEQELLPDDGAPALEDDGAHIADFIRSTQTANLWVTSIAEARRTPFLRPDLSAFGLIRQLHALDFDWICIDLAPGLDPLDVGLFALSDIPLLVATPEPGAVRVTTQFLRHALLEAIRYHPDAQRRTDELESLLYDQPLAFSVESILSSTTSEEVRTIVEEAATELECYLAVNLVREGAEQDLGYVLCHAWHRALSLFPRYLSAVDYENRRWFYHRRTTGKSAVRGDEALSRDIEKLAQTILDISAVDAKFPRPVPNDKDAIEDDLHPALQLGISPDSSRNEVRQHCRQLWEGYKRERAVDVVFDDSETRPAIAEELETLYRKVLTLPSDTFDSVRDLEAPPGTRVGLSASSSSSPEHRATSPPRGSRSAPPEGTRSGSEGLGSSSSTGESADENSEQMTGGPDDSSGPRTEPPDQSTPPDRSTSENTPAGATGDDLEEDLEPLPDVGAPDHSEPGELIEAMRRRESISLQELSRRTHVGVKYLTAIEDGDIDVLPRPVYLRGYLRDIARAFDVDADALVRAYVDRLDDSRL